MSRLSALLRRVFGATRPVIEDISRELFATLLAEIKSGRRTRLTDDEIRDRIETAVTEYIDKKYPAYAFLTHLVIHNLVEMLRAALDKKR